MNHHGRLNPLHIMAALTGLCLLLAAVVDPGLFRLDAPGAAAVGGYAAVDALGQIDAADTPFYTSSSINNTPSARGFSLASGMAIDTVNHRLFVLEGFNSRVLVFNLDSSDNLIDRVADNVLCQTTFKTFDTGVTQSLCSLYSASDGRFTGVAYDSVNDRLFVADGGNDRVLIFDTSTITNGMNAANVIGQPDFTTNTPSVTQSTMRGVNGLVYDSVSGQLFVADGIIFGGSAGHRIMVFDASLANIASSGNGMNAEHVLGQPDFDPHGAGSGTTGFYDPEGLAYDTSSSYLFVADVNQRVMVFDVGVIVDGEPAVNVLGDPDFSGPDVCIGSASASCLGEVWGLSIDQAARRLFVSDVYNNRVMVFDVTAVGDGEPAVNVIGQPDFISSGLGTSQSAFGFPIGVTYGSSTDTLYVSAGGTRILLFDADTGTITDGEPAYDLLGQLDENDQPVYTTDAYDDSPNPQGFNNVSGTFIDTIDHRLFVADYDNHRVLVFELDVSNQLVDHTADFVLGQPDFKTVTSGTTPSSMFQPIDFAYDYPTKRLFVADTFNNRILVFDLSLGITSGMNAANVIGQPDFTSNANATDQDHMHLPSGLAFDADNQLLFVAEDGDNRRITVWDAAAPITDGEPALNVLGQPDFDTGTSGTAQDKIAQPGPLLFDSVTDRLYAIDYPNNRVMIWDLSGGITNGMLAANVLGQDDFTGSGANTSQDGFSSPYGLALDNALDRLFVADTDNSRVLIFDISGGLTDGMDAEDVIGQSDFVTSGGGTTQVEMQGPDEMSFDQDNNRLYVSDSPNNRIMMFEVLPLGSPGATGGHEATDVVGQLTDDEEPLFINNGTDNGPNQRGLTHPTAAEVDTVHHRLFVRDEYGRILVHDLDSSDHLVDRIPDHVMFVPDYKTDGDALGNPGSTDMTYDSANDLLFSTDWDYSRVLVYDTSTITGDEVPIHVLGQFNYDDSDCNLTAWGMCQPQGIEYDAVHKRLFVAQQNQNRVLVFDLSAGITDGMDASWVLGQPDFFSDAGNNTQDGMGAGIKVAYDPTRDLLYVQDGNPRVLEYDVATITNGEPAEHVLGQPDFTSSGPGLDDSSLGTNFNHSGLAIDTAAQWLYVVDGDVNNRVMVWDVNTITDGEPAIHVLGQPDFTSDGAGGGTSGMNQPWGDAYAANRLYIGDFGNNRMQIFDTTSLSDGMAASDLLGQLNPDDTPNYIAVKPDNGPNTQGLDGPDDVVIDPIHHRMFVVEEGNNRVLVFNLDDQNQPVDHTGDFVLGQPDFKSYAAGLSASGLTTPVDVSYDGVNDLLFVTDPGNNRVLIFDVEDIDNGEDAVNVLGQTDFTSGDCNRGLAADADTLCAGAGVIGVSVEPLNNLLAVADGGNNRALIYDVRPAGSAPADLCGNGNSTTGLADGMPASCVIGQLDFISTTPGTDEFTLDNPVAVLAETNTDSLWVADYSNNRVLRYNLFDPTDGRAAINVLGQPDFTSNACETTQSGMCSPSGMALVESDSADQRLFVSDQANNRILVFDTFDASIDGIIDGEDAVDAYGQADFSSNVCDTTQTNFCGTGGVDYDETSETLYVADEGNKRVLLFGPEPSGTGGGGPQPTPEPVGFTPGRIIINRDDAETDSRNVLVSVYAQTTSNFTGIVDVLLSNTTDFSTFVPFRYVIPERLPNGSTTRDIWPKTIAWDLCFGLTDTSSCSLGNKIVYARFYVNVPPPIPVLVPTPVLTEHP